MKKKTQRIIDRLADLERRALHEEKLEGTATQGLVARVDELERAQRETEDIRALAASSSEALQQYHDLKKAFTRALVRGTHRMHRKRRSQ